MDHLPCLETNSVEMRMGEGMIEVSAEHAQEDITRDLYKEVMDSVEKKPKLVEFDDTGTPGVVAIKMGIDTFPNEILLDEPLVPAPEEYEETETSVEADGTIVKTTKHTLVDTKREEKLDGTIITTKTTTITTTIEKDGPQDKSKQVLTERKIRKTEQRWVGGKTIVQDVDPHQRVSQHIPEDATLTAETAEKADREVMEKQETSVEDASAALEVAFVPAVQSSGPADDDALLVQETPALAEEKSQIVAETNSSALVDEVLAQMEEATAAEGSPVVVCETRQQEVTIPDNTFPDEVILESDVAPTTESMPPPPAESDAVQTEETMDSVLADKEIVTMTTTFDESSSATQHPTTPTEPGDYHREQEIVVTRTTSTEQSPQVVSSPEEHMNIEVSTTEISTTELAPTGVEHKDERQPHTEVITSGIVRLLCY